jgi:iron complex outermembrane recepter protein
MRNQRHSTIFTALNACSTAILVASGVAVAPHAAAQSEGLEEIVVTARKREENIQNVGLSVSALGQREIDRTFARDLKDLASMSPNLVIDDTSQGPGGVAAIYIRGIGVADVEKNFDPAVGVVIDQVFIGANSGAILKGIDIARMEVLRGPQGTLFGRNTIGGVINVERTKPTGELGGKVRASYGDYDTYRVDGILNFPITDTLAAKLSGAKNEQREGYYDNIVSGDDAGRTDYESFGVNLLFTPGDSMSLEYTYNYEDIEQDTPPLLNTGQSRHLFCSVYGYCSPSLNTTITGDRLKVSQVGLFPPLVPNSVAFNATTPADLQRRDLDSTFGTDTHIVEWGWDVNEEYRVDAVYGLFGTSETVLSDWDGTPEMLYGTSRPANYEQTSFELRLTKGGDGPLRGTVGVYLWKSSYDIHLRSYIGFAAPGAVLDIAQFSRQDTDSKAVFAEFDYDVTDKLTLTLGGRYTEDKKYAEQRGLVDTRAVQALPGLPQLDGDPHDKWNQFTPKLGAKYQMTDDAMAYFTYSKGYRSGGFNGRVATYVESVEPYNEETVENFELGLKSEWLDNRLRFNGAVFLMKYDDRQEEIHLPDTSSGTGQKTVVANASTAEMKGVELELQAYPTDGISLRANLAYLDASYDEFEFDDDGNPATPLVDLSHLEFRRAPEWTGNVDATYEWNVGGNTMWARVAYHYLGSHETNFDNSPEVRNDAQHLIDASINYEFGSTRVSLFGMNLSDEDGYMIGYDVAGIWSYAATRPPRTWGVEITHEFGGSK